MVARHFALSSFKRPLGNLTRTLSSILVSKIAEFPPERASLPPSPGLSSTLHTGVPSGILSRVVTFPGLNETLSPKAMFCPTDIPSGAAM